MNTLHRITVGIALLTSPAFADAPTIEKLKLHMNELFLSKGVESTARSNIYIAAWAWSKNKICGEDNLSREAATNIYYMYQRSSDALGVQPKQFKIYFEMFNQNIKSTLDAHPDDVELFCKEGGKRSP